MNKGSLAILYKDCQNNKDPIGVARLKQFVKFGYPFILDEEPDTVQRTYILEYWEIEWLEKYVNTINPERKIFPLRTLCTEGLTPTSLIKDEEEPIFSQMPVDKFIVINGIEIF